MNTMAQRNACLPASVLSPCRTTRYLPRLTHSCKTDASGERLLGVWLPSMGLHLLSFTSAAHRAD